jgi:hypothetical protein
MRTLSAGILALVGAAFLIMTATPGTARVGEADVADANVIETSTTTADSGTPEPLVVPAPPVTPVPIDPLPWPVELPSGRPESAWPIFGPLRSLTVDVTPQEILPEPGSDGPSVQKKGGEEILPVFEFE